MDGDIHFGDMEEEKPRVMRRPDEDRRLATRICGQENDADLPIFVDFDTLREMEEHALSDTGVELGGVLLGGQYVDDQGRPFVVVGDCLRADHYESTKGSFKFTHDTWSDITRRLAEFPDELRMVGWYHTHPDWGVFLSGMDLFICENFFNKKLDLALVIDPCRGDVGWFQWTANSRADPRRTAGFHITASRYREQELDDHVRQLEEGSIMPLASRSSTSSPGVAGSSVVNVVPDRNPWPMVAMFGMLSLQTLLVALLAWRMLLPAENDTAKQLAVLLEREREVLHVQAQRAVLDDLTQRLTDSPKGLVEDYEKEIARRKELEVQTEAFQAAHEKLSADLKAEKKLVDETAASLTKSEEKRLELKKETGEELAKLKAELATLRKSEKKDGKEEAEATATGFGSKQWILGSLLAGVALIFAVLAWTSRRPVSNSIDAILEEKPLATRDATKNPFDEPNKS